MAVEKLSVSFNADLVALIRAAAAEEGVSLSTWLANAAEAKARQRHLRRALDAYAEEHGELTDEQVDRLIADARVGSRATRPKRGVA